MTYQGRRVRLLTQPGHPAPVERGFSRFYSFLRDVSAGGGLKRGDGSGCFRLLPDLSARRGRSGRSEGGAGGCATAQCSALRDGRSGAQRAAGANHRSERTVLLAEFEVFDALFEAVGAVVEIVDHVFSFPRRQLSPRHREVAATVCRSRRGEVSLATLAPLGLAPVAAFLASPVGPTSR